MKEIKITGIYRHFKGNEYKVLNIALDCEDPKRKLVIYKGLKEDSMIWVREYNDFCENLVRDGKEFERFTFIKFNN